MSKGMATYRKDCSGDDMESGLKAEEGRDAVFQLIPGIQCYEWGKLAIDGSLVAQFAAATEQLEFKCEYDRPYAELWMGTHSTLPSFVVDSSRSEQLVQRNKDRISLNSRLQEMPSLLGRAVLRRFGAGLPFLFKVLSIGKALSIQAHPDKRSAEVLHDNLPDRYKDANHKPEMAIALTKFKGLCGFRHVSTVLMFIDHIPELRKVLKLEQANQASLRFDESSRTPQKEKTLLKALFAKLMKASQSEVTMQIQDIARRYQCHLEDCKSEHYTGTIEISTELATLFVKLNHQYPGDVGVLCIFFLNVVDLEPGEAMFLHANEPHAYVEGDIVECMAASDNVVRAGLTTKERDVDILLEMLTYDMAPASALDARMEKTGTVKHGQHLVSLLDLEHLYEERTEKEQEPSTRIYDPPIEEFAVLRVLVATGKHIRHRPFNGPSIVIVTKGQGVLTTLPDDKCTTPKEMPLKGPGQIIFIGADTRIELTNAEKRGQVLHEELEVFRAFVEC